MRKLDSLNGYEGHLVSLGIDPLDNRIVRDNRNGGEIRKNLDQFTGSYSVDSVQELTHVADALRLLFAKQPVMVGTVSIGTKAVDEKSLADRDAFPVRREYVQRLLFALENEPNVPPENEPATKEDPVPTIAL